MNEHDEFFDAPAAYARFLATKARRPNRAPWYAGGALAAVAALAILFGAPVGSIAQSFLTIFQPKQFVAIDVSSMQGKHALLPALGDYGTFASVRPAATSRPASLAEASAFAGFRVLSPASVPDQVGSAHGYRAMKATVNAFRFDAARARKSVARTGKALPPMPAGIDGTRVTIAVGPMVETIWGSARAAFNGRSLRSAFDRDGLVVIQSRAPVVRSSGASLADLEDYLLRMPGLSPELADQIRAIGDPGSTLPVPIVGAKQSAHPVDIGGAPGLAIGDNTGLGAGVLWQRDGYVYAVFGTLTQDQVVAIATSLR
jgi:hypothetical protein